MRGGGSRDSEGAENETLVVLELIPHRSRQRGNVKHRVVVLSTAPRVSCCTFERHDDDLTEAFPSPHTSSLNRW